ncbi:sensor histidine kinase [Asanoa sp. WMMD1127]|uniref:sensor histidine kinase n=1 Tax=Asanoa sp. WMMD1127 TaxID=3016107 RepID=UPI002416B6B2|nr:sensor histidine kinase [Asanoa sp. WMMD1127]MDG4825918.1 sensor histidine kinase [Asanoa sp. WMMD1127]
MRNLQAATLALTVAAVVEALVRTAPADPPFLVLVGALAMASTAPLALRNATVAAAVVTVAMTVSIAGFRLATVAGVLAQLVAAYLAGRRGALAIAVPLGLPFLVLAFGHPVAVVLAGLVPACALAGAARRVSRADAAHLAARDAYAGTLVEHTARGERARIARELHDVVAHHISMISVQAENARFTTPGLPAAGAERFAAIGGTARAALTEMRRLLGVLRADAAPVTPERRPQPGLRELAALLDEARDAAGSGARLILRGPPVPLDPGVELAAYRIVQEALTNARRHAPGAAVDVEITYRADGLGLRIRDNGPGPEGAAAGHGLSGMRERAVAVGGRLRTGVAGPAGGFVVEATLPIREDT